MSCESNYQLVLLYVSVLVVLTVHPKRVEPAPVAEEQTTPTPLPPPVECFPIEPQPRPLPTFSGTVYDVNNSTDFRTRVTSAETDITIRLDGSQPAYTLLSSQSITKSLRITS
jgi:hypothetical protein